MKWTESDIEVYAKEREYVDTAVVPLIPISLTSNLKSTVSMGEYINIISNELERQLKGRLLLVPAFTYLQSETQDSRTERFKKIEDELTDGGMKHIITLTSDVDWKQSEEHLSSGLLWMPAIPLEHMDEQHKVETISAQIKQVLQFVTNKWQSSIKG
ncbi:YpiF family protein [Guptibacillus algicola]|uniref:YpiF family protein n=1 Tax=Guptibacillus algicola TaxID=225844 RepID=UPI001CD1AF06|nr:YpiF family protein [Alkalihalobacillus algicola]MCA0985768.1 YpiF family protein [Alkalihalobacillus algicola]